MAERKRDDELEKSTNRWMLIGVALTAAFALMFPIYRLYEPAGRAERRAELEVALAAQGEQLFASTCASCHGADGQGVDAPALNSKQFLESAENDQIESIIAHGIPGSEMSAYSLDFGGPLTSEQIKSITAYIRSWEPNAPDRPDWRTLDGGDGSGGGGHAEDGDPDGDGHDEVPDDDHDEDGDPDGDGHDEVPDDDHDEDGDPDGDGHDEEEPEHDE
ncbi:MAG: cytochrome c [Acidimicrobiales bacterium]